VAEKVLKIKTLSEVAEAISGLTDLSGSLKGVGTAAFEAAGKSKAEWKALEAELAKTTGTAKGMAEQAFKVESALNAMGRAGSASQLETSLVKAKVELNSFKAKIDEVRAAGGTIDDGMVQSLKIQDAAIDAAKAKLEGLKTSTEQANKELGLAGKASEEAGAGVRSVGTAAGESSGKVTRLGDAMKKSSESVTKVKNAVMEWASALQIGVTIGNALVNITNKVATSMERKAAAAEKAALEAQKYQIAMKAVRDGLIEEGETTEETLANYVAMTAAMGKLDEASRKYVAEAGLKVPESFKETAVQGAKMEVVIKGVFGRSLEEGRKWSAENRAAIDAYIAKMSDAQRETSKDFIAMTEAAKAHAEAMKSLPAAIASILPSFKEVVTSSLEAENAVLAMAQSSGQSIEKIREVIEAEYKRNDATGATALGYDQLIAAVDRLLALQKNIPIDIDVEIEARKRLAEAVKDEMAEKEKAIQDYLAKQAAERQANDQQFAANRQRQAEERATADHVEENMRKWTNATQGVGKAFGALSGDFTAINAEVRKFVEEGGKAEEVMTSMQLIALGVAEANDAATASIYRHLEATGLLREEQELALDAAQGWRDYLANLKEGYDTGLSSLSAYIRGLIDFKGQLLQLFSSVSGEAKRGLEDVIAMIEALMQTAGTREAFDTSYAGQAQRAFGKGGK